MRGSIMIPVGVMYFVIGLLCLVLMGLGMLGKYDFGGDRGIAILAVCALVFIPLGCWLTSVGLRTVEGKSSRKLSRRVGLP